MRLSLLTTGFSNGWLAIVVVAIVLVPQAVTRRLLLRTAILLVIAPVLQLAVLQTLDRAFFNVHCNDQLKLVPDQDEHAGYYIEHILAPRMDRMCRNMGTHLTPMSRSFNVSYCNIELARHDLFTTESIADMESDPAYHELVQRIGPLQQEMRSNCPLRSTSPGIGTEQDRSRGIHLTRLALNMADAQAIYLEMPGGVRAAATRVGEASIRLVHALRSLPSEPGFWDQARVTSQQHSTTSFYHQYIRSPLSRCCFLPSPFHWAEWTITTFLQHPGYAQARQAIKDLLLAERDYRSAVSQFHHRRCTCSTGSPSRSNSSSFTDCTFESDLRSYFAKYFSAPSQSLPDDLPPLDYIRRSRSSSAPCGRSELAADLAREPIKTRQLEGVWREDMCGLLSTPARGEVGGSRWVQWWECLGVMPGGVRGSGSGSKEGRMRMR